MRRTEKEYGECAGVYRVQVCYFRSNAARGVCQGLLVRSVRNVSKEETLTLAVSSFERFELRLEY